MSSRPARRPSWVVLTLIAAGASSALAGDWPHWRGPDRTGVSAETDWQDEGREGWSRDVGRGYSSVAVEGGRLFTQGHREDEGVDQVLCLDAETGDELWSHSFPAKLWNKYHEGGTLVTPVADGERVFTCNREGRLFCFDAADGEVRWSKHLKEEYSLRYPEWMFSASPVVLGERLFVNMGVLFCFAKDSGDLIWKTEKSSGDAYSTPLPMDVGGKACLAVFNGDGLVLHAQEDGAEGARFPWKTQYDVNAATPVLVGEDRLFLSSGYGRGCGMVQVSWDEIKPLWESKVMKSHMSGCVFHEGHLYGFDEAVLKCLDPDGNEKWAERGLGKGALIVAGGRLVLLSGKGELIVAAADPEGYQERSRTKLFDGGVCWTTPVLANGRTYSRNNRGLLVCRDHRAGAP